MAYPYNEIPLNNSKGSGLLESLMGFGATSLPMGDGTANVNVPAVPGMLGLDGTNGLGTGVYGMSTIPGTMGGPSVNPIDAFTGTNNTGYQPLTQLGAGSYGSVNPEMTSGDWYNRIMGGTAADGSKTVGMLPVGLGAVQGLGSLFLGMQQYGLAKKQLEEGKRQYDQNYAAQQQTTNTRLEDRQRARVASNPGAYESVGAYMSKNGIK